MNRLYIILFITVIFLFIMPKIQVDDSYILMRYADNFKVGNGLVWNTGEYLQSYTGILMLSLYIISPLPYLVTAYIVGIVSFLLGGWFLCLLLKNSPVLNLILIIYAISPIAYLHIFSGLETILFTTISLSSIYFWRGKMKWLLLVSLILLFLTRPEGVLLSVLLII